jgi:hypothetical protein
VNQLFVTTHRAAVFQHAHHGPRQTPFTLQGTSADDPGYIGFCDASKLGAGGVWLSGTRTLSQIVWHVEWPEDIRNNVVSCGNPRGTITNSELAMAGMLLHFLVLGHLVQLKHVHVAAWCDKTPTVYGGRAAQISATLDND